MKKEIQEIKTLLEKGLDRENGREAARMIFSEMNSFSAPTAEMAESLADLTAFWEICRECVISLSVLYREGYYDARNKYACEIGTKLAAHYGLTAHPINDKGVKAFIEVFKTEHRTLMQTFSEVVFRVFAKNDAALASIFDDDDKWYRMPLI